MGKKNIWHRFAPAYLLVFFLAAVMLLYIGVRLLGTVSSDVETFRTSYVSVDDAIPAEGWFVRDEVVAEGTPSKTVKHIVSSGEKVQADAPLAIVYADTSIMEASRRLDEIDQELALLQAAVQSAGAHHDTTQTDQLITRQIAQLAGQVSDGMPTGSASLALSLRELSLREGASGLEESVIKSQITLLEGEKSRLAGQAYGRSSTISAPAAGFFSEVVDGYEPVLKPDEVLAMQPQQLEALVQQPVQAPEGKLGKVMRGFTWYFAVPLEAADAARLSVGRSVTLKFSQISANTPATVAALNWDETGSRALAVFAANKVDGELISVRKQAVSIVLGTYEGLEVPVTAVTTKTETDGAQTSEVGVYILTGTTARFKNIEKLYQNQTAYIVKVGSESNNGLVAGDQIITGGVTGLRDAKVIK